MKNLIYILILLISLPGCTTQKRCLRKYPPQVTEVEKIITNTEIKYKDTVIYYPLPPEIINNIDTVYITNDTLINSNLSVLQTSLAISSAQIKGNLLYHNLLQKDTTIELRLDNALKEINTLQTQLKQKVTTIEVPAKISWWNRSMIKLGYVFIILMIFALFYILTFR